MRKRKFSPVVIFSLLAVAVVWLANPVTAQDKAQNNNLNKLGKVTGGATIRPQVSGDDLSAALEEGKKLRKVLKYNSGVTPAQRQQAAKTNALKKTDK